MIPWKISIEENIMVFFIYGNLFQKICLVYFLPQRYLPFNEKKGKVCHEKVKIYDSWRKVNENLAQFEATICAKHNKQWKWSKILKITALVLKVQM